MAENILITLKYDVWFYYISKNISGKQIASITTQNQRARCKNAREFVLCTQHFPEPCHNYNVLKR